MSIIHDALKKAQEQRKQSTTGVPFTSGPPEVKKKPRIALIAVVVILAGAVAAYLYIPAFHRQKAPPVNQAKPAASAPKVAAQAKPAQEPDKKEAVSQKEKVLDPGLRRNDERSPSQRGTSAGPAAVKTETKPEQKQSGAIKQQPAVKAAAKPEQTAGVLRGPAVKASKKTKAEGAYQRTVEEPAEEPIRRTPARKTEDERINAQYNEALSAMNSGRTREAQKIFLNILARKPDHVESLNNMGVISASQGNKKEALAYFKKILEYRTNYPKAYNNIGLIMMSEGDSQLAEEYFRKAISLEPEGLEPYLNLSALLRGQKKFQEAAKALDVPIKKNTRDAMLFLSYAVVKDNLGQSEEAIKYYRQYLGLARSSEVRNGVVERLRYLEGRGKK